MSFSFSPKIVTDGLVLYLDAANTRSYVSGSTTWTDLSRGGNNGVLTNGPTFNSANGGSIVFDGIDDFTQLPNLQLSYPFTISFYGKQIVSNTFGPSITFSNPSVNNQSIGLGLNLATSNEIRIWYYSGGYTQSSTIGYSYNQIYQVTGIFTSTGFDLYVNGVYKSTLSGAKSKIWTDTSPSYNLMRLNRVGEIFYGGTLYNTSIYNRALSATEILQNYNATKTRFGI